MRAKICGLLLLNVRRTVLNLVYLIPVNFLCGGLKGKSNTLPIRHPEVCMNDCTYHIKENMKKRENGNATKNRN